LGRQAHIRIAEFEGALMFSRFCWYHRGSFTVMASIMMTVLTGSAGLAATSINGYYAIRVTGVADPLPKEVFKKPGIDGIYLRYYWRDLEPSQGKFHWNDLNHDLARTLAAGKKFSIGIHTGGYSPSWLYAPGTGIRSIAWSEAPHGGTTGCTNYTAPVPYDVPYASAYIAMLSALNDHLAARNALPSLTMVKVTPFNDSSEELHLPSSPYKPGSCQSDAQSAWLALGYRPSLVMAAFKKIYKQMAVIFPDTVFSFNTIQNNSFPGISKDGQKVERSNDMAEAIIGHALSKTPGRVAVEATNLSNVPSKPRLVLWAKDRGAIQGWESNEHGGRHRAGCPDSTCRVRGYRQLVQFGISTGAPYIEIWPNDAISFPKRLVKYPLPQQSLL
jgi:hypothetical protein